MADPRFFPAHVPFTLAELADVAGATVATNADPSLKIVDIAPLDAAHGDTISFLDNRRYIEAFETSRAGACIVRADLADRAPQGMALLLSQEPYQSFARVARAFYPPPAVEPGIASSAVIDPGVVLGAGCRVDSGASIAERCEIGARCHIGGNVVIEAGVVIGDDCIIGACASLSHCLVGDRVVIYPGARIGQEGFGFTSAPEGRLRIPQVGRVIIHDDVEIGANTTIDRGSGPDTIIGRGCMIDNLAQIAHNVQLGRGCVIAAMVGISGSTKLGDFVVCGGQVGFAGHLRIGAGVKLAARSGVVRDIEAGQAYGGAPAVPLQLWKRQVVSLARLAQRKEKS